MTDNIVTFGGNQPEPTEEPVVKEVMLFTCHMCDCRSWKLLSTGAIECANCESYFFVSDTCEEHTDDGIRGWRRIIEAAPEDPSTVPDEGDTVNVRAMPDETLASRSVFRDMERWHQNKKLTFVGGYHEDGRGRWWIGAHNSEQRDWIVRKIEEIVENLKSTKYPDADQGELNIEHNHPPENND
jgi:hypothetical protein